MGKGMGGPSAWARRDSIVTRRYAADGTAAPRRMRRRRGRACKMRAPPPRPPCRLRRTVAAADLEVPETSRCRIGTTPAPAR